MSDSQSWRELEAGFRALQPDDSKGLTAEREDNGAWHLYGGDDPQVERQFRHLAAEAARLDGHQTDRRASLRAWLDTVLDEKEGRFSIRNAHRTEFGVDIASGTFERVCKVAADCCKQLADDEAIGERGGVGSSSTRKARVRRKVSLKSPKKIPGKDRCRIYKLVHKAKLIDEKTGKLRIPKTEDLRPDMYDTLFCDVLATLKVPIGNKWDPPDESFRTIGDAWESRNSKSGELTVGRRMKVWLTRLISNCAPYRETILRKPTKK